MGLLIGYGRFRAAQLGDLTFNREHELICPDNVLGTVDVFRTSAHGLNLSSPRALLHALRPRAVVINNAGRKGASRGVAAGAGVTRPGGPVAGPLRRAAPRRGTSGPRARSRGGRDFNVAEPFIASLDDSTAHFIKMSARADGIFTSTNARTGFEKEYAPRGE